jgi:hypothetical protein
MIRPYLPLTLTFVLGLGSSVAQQSSIARPDGSRIATSEIDASVTRLMEAAHVTGAGIALFHHGKVVIPQDLRPA